MHSAKDKSTVCALLVDPDVSFRQAVSGTLYAYFPCIDVEEACEESEALIKVAYLRPNIIFMAKPLSGENGLTLAKEIKEVCNNITVVMLTTNDLPEHAQQTLKPSVDYFISKSSNGFMKDILARIEEAIGGRRSWSGRQPRLD
jgi:DNA-binding NarL/FixJ family response regulator